MSIGEGQTVGNYRILQRIGSGGMGAVYLAEHPLIGKKVALKVIHRELSGNREVIGRFFNEARSVNRIGNEHIVEVHDFGQDAEGHYFFIMEYLEGRTLAGALHAERVLPVQRALHIGAQIADALGAAHTAGIIHRDLKPDNIMLVTRLGDPDFVKVLDFGLAKMFADGMTSNLTAQGVVLGTPQYMSPEACESKRDIDHRTDIYGLGILLFQMLCGQVPFDGESMGQVLVQQVTHAPPAPRALNPHIPPSVEQIILRCLAKAPDARFPTMLALRDALLDPDRYLASSPPVVPAALTRSSPAARTLFVDSAGPVVPAQPAAGAALGYAQTSAMPAAQAPGRQTGPAMALPAPPPSIMHHGPLPGGHGGHGGADARTMIADGGGPAAAEIAQTRKSSVAPAMQLPVQAANHTMVIGTPPGYKDRPPRRTGVVVLVVMLIAAAIGGGIALAVVMGGGDGDGAAAGAAAEGGDGGDGAGTAAGTAAGTGSATAAGAGTGTGAGTGAGTGSGAAAEAAPPDAGAAAEASADAAAAAVEPILAVVKIESTPSGAEVIVDGVARGATPATLELPPDGAEHELIVRHPSAREERKVLTITGDQTIRLELEVIKRDPKGTGGTPGAGGTGGKGGKGGKGGGGDKKKPPDDDDGLMKPPWAK